MNNKKLQLKQKLVKVIVIAGIFGGFTAKISILFTQGLPALLALIVTLWAKR